MIYSVTSLDTIRVEVVGEARAVTMPASLWLDMRDKLPKLIADVETSLQQLDQLAELWGDEGVFRRCRDRLRKAIADARVYQ